MSAVHRPAKAYRQLEEMLADRKVEAVVIGVADAYHVPLARLAVEAGKHVLVEKPLGVTVEECEALRQLVWDGNVTFQVGNNRRFDPGVAYAREFIRNQAGQIQAVKAWYCDSTYRYDMTDNLQPIPVTSAEARKPEGQPKEDKRRYYLMTHGSHLIDTARYLAGELVRVRARLREMFGAWSWFVEVEFGNRAMGHLDLTIPVRGDFEEGFQVYCEHGSVKGQVYLPWFHKASHVECFSTSDRQYHRPLGEDAHSYKRQIEGFTDTILHDKPQCGANIDDGVAAMRGLVAIARSIENGGDWVNLAEVTGGV
jgi:predicted dehydrogenase